GATPQRLGEGVDRDPPTVLEQEVSEQATPLRATDRAGLAGGLDGHRAEQCKPHVASRATCRWRVADVSVGGRMLVLRTGADAVSSLAARVTMPPQSRAQSPSVCRWRATFSDVDANDDGRMAETRVTHPTDVCLKVHRPIPPSSWEPADPARPRPAPP